MTEAEVYAALDDTFKEVFLRDDIVLSPALSAQDVEGWDSFKQIEIILAVQERFAIKFSTRELDGMQRVGDLVAIVLARN